MLACEDGAKEVDVALLEEIEALQAAPVVFDGAADLVEDLVSGAVVIEVGEEVEVACVGGGEQLLENAQGIDGFLDGGVFHLGRAVTVFHLAVVLEEGDIVDRGLDAKDAAALVVHLDRGGAH